MGKYSEEFTLEENRTVINMGKEEDLPFLVSLAVSGCCRLLHLRDGVSIKATRLVPFPAVPVLPLFTEVKQSGRIWVARPVPVCRELKGAQV